MKLADLKTALGDVLQDAAGGNPRDSGDVVVHSVHYRAQDVTPGGLFVAVKGFSADGHDYIDQAVSNGAVAVVCERTAAVDAAILRVTDSRKALALAAAAFYGDPSRKMTLIGITGTNGKTTTSYLVESVLAAAGFSCGVIGTINYRYNGRLFDNPVTTPESLDLQRILADMHAAGVTHAVMEVSSHALDLKRVHGCLFDIGVFTNLTQDHLDYHHTMEAYWQCKRVLFDSLLPAAAGDKQPRAVFNGEDPKGRELGAGYALPFLYTGQRTRDEVHVKASRFTLNGIDASIETPEGAFTIRSPLVGRHNLENILNAIGVGVSLGIAPETIRQGIDSLENVPGRLERVANNTGRFVYVDYAHTPDALENALLALRALTADRIVCVFGCGGDRDRTKRPKMGELAARLSDLAVVTSDNPRTEAPESIIDDILEGVRPVGGHAYKAGELADNGFRGKGYVVAADRRQAICLSVAASRPGDTILIAGKGHEPYQIVGRQKLVFDDREEAARALAQ